MSVVHPSVFSGFGQAASDNYHGSRPSYVAEHVELVLCYVGILQDSGAPSGEFPNKRVVELGTGTGKLSEVVLGCLRKWAPTATSTLNCVFTDPAGMSDKFTSEHPDQKFIQCAADQLHSVLEGQSASLVIAGQAFHWFANSSSLANIAEVLEPGGHFVAIWNIWDIHEAWVHEYAEIISSYYEEDTPRQCTGMWRSALVQSEIAGLFHQHVELEVPQQARFAGNEDFFINYTMSLSDIAKRSSAEKVEIEMRFRSFFRGAVDVFSLNAAGQRVYSIPMKSLIAIARKKSVDSAPPLLQSEIAVADRPHALDAAQPPTTESVSRKRAKKVVRLLVLSTSSTAHLDEEKFVVAAINLVGYAMCGFVPSTSHRMLETMVSTCFNALLCLRPPLEVFAGRAPAVVEQVACLNEVSTAELEIIRLSEEMHAVVAPFTASEISDGSPVQYSMRGVILEAGEIARDADGCHQFCGVVKWIHTKDDLRSVGPGHVVLLLLPPKEIAFEALCRAGAGINMTRSYTAHIQNGRCSSTPYAIVEEWEGALPRDGEFVTIKITMAECVEWNAPPLIDVPPSPVDSKVVSIIGGKAYGLRVLEESIHRLRLQSAKVPNFVVLPTTTIHNWLSSSRKPACASSACVDQSMFDKAMFLERAQQWVEDCFIPSQLCGSGGRWAVRSSANIEDAEKDSMSGTFESVLNVPTSELHHAIRQVVWSLFSPEALIRAHQLGISGAEPAQYCFPIMMAVVVCRMVANPFLAGAVMIPYQADSSTFVIEGKLDCTAASLMDGSVLTDVRALVTVNGEADGDGVTIASVDVSPLSLRVHTIEPSRLRSALELIAKQAWTLYLSTGRGDLEYAITPDNMVAWLQARVNTCMVETSQQKTYHLAAFASTVSIAFNTSLANRMKQPHFRVAIDGQNFAFSHGIRRRDWEFHSLLEKDLSILPAVTRFGLRVDSIISKLVSAIASAGEWTSPHVYLNGLTPEHVLTLLSLHAAVQSPFSIPVDSRLSNRSATRPVDVHKCVPVLTTFLATVFPAHDTATVFKELWFTHTSCDLVRLRAQNECIRAVRAGRSPDVLHLWSFLTGNMDRGVGLSSRVLAYLRVQATLQAYLPGNAADTARREYDEHKAVREHWDAHKQRRQLLSEEIAGDSAAPAFELWADYLEMKSLTNEHHDFYRSLVLVWAATIGYEPAPGTLLHATDEFVDFVEAAVEHHETSIWDIGFLETKHDEESAECTRSISTSLVMKDDRNKLQYFPVQVIESADAYARLVRPIYLRANIPNLIMWHITGRSHFINKCIRAGLVAHIKVDGAFGSYFLHPNPGYHDNATAEFHQRIGHKLFPINVHGSSRSAEFPPRKLYYAYIAWWIHPSMQSILDNTLHRVYEPSMPRSESEKPLRQTSEGASPDNYAESSIERPALYLSTMRDLQQRDLPLLKALEVQARSFLVAAGLGPPANFFVHYPYRKPYSTLHVHIRSARHPMETDMPVRTNFDLHDIIQKLEEQPLSLQTREIRLGFQSKTNAGFLLYSEEIASHLQEHDGGVFTLAPDSSLHQSS